MLACVDHQSLNDKMFDYQIVFDGTNWFAWYHWDANIPLADARAKQNGTA